ncbi:MAG: hypothetical protein FJ387_15760, partial [Verrucomicrobia bacterium]|nr:hypothetical protein [Verrucomicrobiota bacterium]
MRATSKVWVVVRLALGLMLLLGPGRAQAQIDPEKRSLLQFGFNQPIEGRGPIAGYAFYYQNQPEFIRSNLTLRLAVAPVYLDSELGVSGALGAHTDLGFSLAGGGFASSFSEVRGGKLWREESFTGHGAEAGVSVYHRFNPRQVIPLNAVARVAVDYDTFARDPETAVGFELPEDRATLRGRTGLRWGGAEPRVLPAVAMELSLWYEVGWRQESGPYGYGGDRAVEALTQLYWGRALLAYTFPELQHNFSLSLTAGSSVDADRLSAYRLGGFLPLVAEFPLNLPGYYYQELSARRFALISGQYSWPVDAAKRWAVMIEGGTAVVEYLRGLDQPGDWHSGVGGGVGFRSANDRW